MSIIESETNSKIVTGNKIRLMFLPFIIKEISKYLKKDLSEIEILILSNEVEDSIELIKGLPNEIKKIYLYNKDPEKGDYIGNNIFDSIGLSIILKRDIKDLHYPIIINMGQTNILYKDSIRRDTIIFDINEKKPLNLYHKNIDKIIYDISFFPKDIRYKNILGLKLPINSAVYEAMGHYTNRDFWGFITNSGKIQFHKFMRKIIIKGRL